MSVGELVARKRDQVSRGWCSAPHGLGCRCIRAFTWPKEATRVEDLGTIECEVRTGGGFSDYDVTSLSILVESLVIASDWILATHVSGFTVRGAPVTIRSPLAVGYKHHHKLCLWPAQRWKWSSIIPNCTKGERERFLFS